MSVSTTPTRAKIDPLTASRLKGRKMKVIDRNGVKVIENFAVFIDTHRDQPHVGVFFEDIHRGQCRPVMVDYIITDDLILDRGSGRTMQRHDKHMFVTTEFFAQFLMDAMMNTGADPRDGEGCLPTSHFRNARAVVDPTTGAVLTGPVYHLKSFREIVRLRHNNG